MGDSWIVSNLNAALTTWNDKLGEIWQLLTPKSADLQGWSGMGCDGGHPRGSASHWLRAAGTLLRSRVWSRPAAPSWRPNAPEQALKLFIRFALAKAAVTYGLDLMLAIFQIVQGMVSTVINQSGVSGMSAVTLPPGSDRRHQ